MRLSRSCGDSDSTRCSTAGLTELLFGQHVRVQYWFMADMQAPACRTGERQTLCVKHAGRDIAGGGKREASVANDSVMDRSEAS